MGAPFTAVIRALQFVVLQMFYTNFEALVAIAHREITHNNTGSVTFIRFPKSIGGMSVVMRRDSKAKYYIDFEQIPYDLGPRDVTIKLGTGKHLINHRVMNDLGVRLNQFLDNEEYRRSLSILRVYALEKFGQEVVVERPGFFARWFGVEITNYDEEFNKVSLPSLYGRHSTNWKKFHAESKASIQVRLYGDIVLEV
ncbi:hypothetical protein [Vibrio phage phiKT1028]|nr:hypothetical protein [Vibrio phage phiKT1028]